MNIGIMINMTERYVVKGTDEFFQHIEDTTLTEDKHEGAIYDIHQVTRRLNEQDNQIEELQKENSLFKELFTVMLRQIEVEIRPDNLTAYSGTFIFTAEQFRLLKQFTKGD